VRHLRSDAGFSLIELSVSTVVLLIVSSIVTSALLQMTDTQKTIWNRTEMHSGIRGATELLQQEVGQAGRVSVPVSIVLGAPVTAATSCNHATPDLNAVSVAVSSATGVFASAAAGTYELLTTLDGNDKESVKVASVNTASTPHTITACFTRDHLAGTVLVPLGSFATGIIPPFGIIGGSTDSVLKMYGDINGDGNMVYVEYTCDTGAHKLYRNVMAFDETTKPPLTDAQVLLANIQPNPGGTPCFTYQTVPESASDPPFYVQGTPMVFVIDVAITLTVQTEQVDPVTKQFQTETKALLNVSPRNVFHAWMLAGMGYTDRIQSTPGTVTNLLP